MKIFKQSLLVAATTLFFLSPIQAQNDKSCEKGKHCPPRVEDVVSGLSNPQKNKLEGLQKDSRERVKKIKQEQKVLRDSIRNIMMQEGDHSSELFPLFEREGVLQTAMSKEMYTTKVKIDQILNKEQRAEYRAKMKQRRHEQGATRKDLRKSKGKRLDKGVKPNKEK